MIVAGHTRYNAAKKLGIKSVPCVVAYDLTGEQIKAFRLAYNKVAEKADWDFDLLDDELDDILDIDMEVFGFEFNLDEEENAGLFVQRGRCWTNGFRYLKNTTNFPT